MTRKDFTIDEARELSSPKVILTDEILTMYDSVIRSAIMRGASSATLKFIRKSSNGRDESPGFSYQMDPSRGLTFLSEHYRKCGFTVSDVKKYTPDQRDIRESGYTYVEVSGWTDRKQWGVEDK